MGAGGDDFEPGVVPGHHASVIRFLPFVLKHLRRNTVRTASTIAAMALCILLFCTLQSALARFNRVVDTRSPRRLVTRNAITFMIPVPQAFGPEIRSVPGVRRVAIMNGFGGVLPAAKEGKDAGGATDWSNAFQNVAVDAEPYFAMNPELVVAPEELRDFMKDLHGCVIGRDLARRFGWKTGDRFFLESFVAAYRRKEGPFEFVIRGLMDADPRYPGTETEMMVFHFKYLDEALGGGIKVMTFLVEIDDPARGAETGAAIDALFENSVSPTLTETEKSFTADFMSMAGDLGVVINGVGLTVCFAILLVTANTLSMTVRERRTEIAVLKTLGFTSAEVMGLVVTEALLIGAAGGILGVAGTGAIIWALDHATTGTFYGFAGMELRPAIAASGLGVAMVLGLAAGLMPAWGAYRARVAETLRGV
jgi:putative ABC transport system permease protein